MDVHPTEYRCVIVLQFERGTGQGPNEFGCALPLTGMPLLRKLFAAMGQCAVFVALKASTLLLYRSCPSCHFVNEDRSYVDCADCIRLVVLVRYTRGALLSIACNLMQAGPRMDISAFGCSMVSDMMSCKLC